MRVLLALCCVTLTGAGVWALLRPPPARPLSEDHAASAQHDEIVALREEVARLKGSVTGQVAKLAAQQQAAATPAPVAPRRSRPTESEARAAYDGMVSRVVGRYARERPDPAWSPGAEAAIAHDLTTGGLDKSVTHVECASTICKIEMDLADPDLLQDLPERFAELPSLQSETFFQREPGTDSSKVTLYVARPEHHLPLAPER
jgi:hypothetical protein